MVLGLIYFYYPKESANSAEYTIKEINNFLSHEECDLIIKLATEHGLKKSGLYEGNKDEYDETVRKSENTWLEDGDHPTIAEISKRVAKLVNIPVSHQESLQVVHYGVGGKYEPHFDACKDDKKKCERMNGKSGARYMTVLIYLNTVEEGGGTRFPEINKIVKAEKGKAVVFQNVDPSTEKVLPKALHGGDPVLKGEKWICNKWIHIKPL